MQSITHKLRPKTPNPPFTTHNLTPVTLREIGLLLMVAFVCAGLILAASSRGPRLNLISAGSFDLGPAFLDGLYGLEEHPDGSTFRWSSGATVIQIRGAFDLAPNYVASLRLRAEHPSAAQPLTFLLGGQPVATVTPETRFRTYHMLGGAGDQSGRELWVAFQTPTFLAPDNPRDLGVMLTDAQVRGLAEPKGGFALGAALAIVALWASVRRMGASPFVALGFAALGACGLIALIALPRPPVIPPPALALVLLGGLVGAAAVSLTRPQTHAADAPNSPQPTDPNQAPAWYASLAPLSLAAMSVLVSLSGRLWAPWLSDDALISFRYAQNLVQGHGLVYNPGERVEGYTNFLWTILAAPVIAVGFDVALWAHLAGTSLGVAILLCGYRLALRLLPSPPWAMVAALIIASSQSLLLYTGRGAGLETGLFTLLTLLATGSYLRGWTASRDGHTAAAHRNLRGAGVLLALAALTRPEGALLFALSVAHFGGTLLPPLRRIIIPAPEARLPLAGFLRLIGAFALIFGPYFIWRVWYYGDLLPNTFYAKTGGGMAQILRGVAYAGGFALTLGGPLLLVMGVPWWRDWRAALRSWRSYLFLIVTVYSAYIVAVGGDHFRGERFFVPLIPFFAILISDGLAAVGVWARPWFTQAKPVQQRVIRASLSLLLVAGASAAWMRTAPFDEIMQGLDESVWIWREIGWWLSDHTPPDASVAVEAAGAIAFFGERTTIDMLGLTDRHIGRLDVAGMGTGVAGHEKRDPVYVLEVRRPTYIPKLWEGYFGGAAVLEGPYQRITVTTRTGRQIQLWERVVP